MEKMLKLKSKKAQKYFVFLVYEEIQSPGNRVGLKLLKFWIFSVINERPPSFHGLTFSVGIFLIGFLEFKEYLSLLDEQDAFPSPSQGKGRGGIQPSILTWHPTDRVCARLKTTEKERKNVSANSLISFLPVSTGKQVKEERKRGESGEEEEEKREWNTTSNQALLERIGSSPTREPLNSTKYVPPCFFFFRSSLSLSTPFSLLSLDSDLGEIRQKQRWEISKKRKERGRCEHRRKIVDSKSLVLSVSRFFFQITVHFILIGKNVIRWEAFVYTQQENPSVV